MLRGVLLDIDGTLLASNRAHADAWAEALAEFGHHIPVDRIEPMIGMGGDRVLAKLVPGLNDQEGEGKEIVQRRQRLFLQEYLPKLEPTPGARALVQRLREEGLQITIATSAKDEELQHLLEAAHIEDLIETKTTSDDAAESKPAPDIVAAALKKSALNADEVLMIGDTPYDVESAGRAQVGVIAVRCGGHDDAALAGAVAVYDDPADLLAHFDQSPLSRQAQP